MISLELFTSCWIFARINVLICHQCILKRHTVHILNSSSWKLLHTTYLYANKQPTPPAHDVDSTLHRRWYLVTTSNNLFSTSIQRCQVRRRISSLSQRWINVKINFKKTRTNKRCFNEAGSNSHRASFRASFCFQAVVRANWLTNFILLF